MEISDVVFSNIQGELAILPKSFGALLLTRRRADFMKFHNELRPSQFSSMLNFIAPLLFPLVLLRRTSCAMRMVFDSQPLPLHVVIRGQVNKNSMDSRTRIVKSYFKLSTEI